VLPYERKTWSGGGGTAASADFWVKAPTVPSSGTQTIYLYYGNSAVSSDGQNATAVWDSKLRSGLASR